MKISSPITMAYPGPPRRAAGLARYVLLALGLLVVLFYFRAAAQNVAFGSSNAPIDVVETTPAADPPAASIPKNPPQTPVLEKPKDPEDVIEFKPEDPVTKPKTIPHPIDELIQTAEKRYDDLLKKESHDLNTAAAKYRERRGRHPPPGFDAWYKFAAEHNAVMVEDFFDQIYHDLNPFWGMEPKQMRREAWAFDMTINVRNHNATSGSDWFWTQMWLDMLKTIEHLLPDMDIALNAMDEPRVAVPWEDIDKLMKIEESTRSMAPPPDVVSNYQSLDHVVEPDVEVIPKEWENNLPNPFWGIARRGCPPDSLARLSDEMTNFNNTPTISLAHTLPHTYKGYVSNSTLAGDFCHQPDMQSIHGMMIEPLSVFSTKKMFPMFGGSKLAINNEILLPAPVYWNNDERFSGGDTHGPAWPEKDNKVIWRGVATGGRNRETNWKGFQRHRFVAMTNATKIGSAENWTHIPENFGLPTTQYDLKAQQEGKLGEWTGQWAETGFMDLFCSPPEENMACNYTDPYFKLLPGVPMKDMFKAKYLPDIDGNSFSGRYRGFLLSTSLPIKATIFREWHDSRLVAWKHFVPMDNRYLDFYGIMEYFLGFEGERYKVEGRDKVAEKLATEGQEWANKVLRKEDMQIYTLRLLLEYARVSDERRGNMGWVGDLVEGKGAGSAGGV